MVCTQSCFLFDIIVQAGLELTCVAKDNLKLLILLPPPPEQRD